MGGLPQPGFCWMSKALKHNYLDYEFEPDRDFFWKDYLRDMFEQYIVHGKNMDIIYHEDKYSGWCLPTSQDEAWVKGPLLTGLPATQHEGFYSVAGEDGTEYKATVHFSGGVRKESEWLKGWHTRVLEVLSVQNEWHFDDDVLLVTRKSANANIRDMFFVGSFGVQTFSKVGWTHCV